MPFKIFIKKNEWLFHTAIVIAVWFFYYIHTPPNWTPTYFDAAAYIIGMLYGVFGTRGVLRHIKNNEENKILRYFLYMFAGALILLSGVWDVMRH